MVTLLIIFLCIFAFPVMVPALILHAVFGWGLWKVAGLLFAAYVILFTVRP